MILFRSSVGETCPCTSVQHGATETVAFVCSAVIGRVCQCKISAKYGCSVTTALVVYVDGIYICSAKVPRHASLYKTTYTHVDGFCEARNMRYLVLCHSRVTSSCERKSHLANHMFILELIQN